MLQTMVYFFLTGCVNFMFISNMNYTEIDAFIHTVHTSDSSVSQNIHVSISFQRQIVGILQRKHWIALWG